MFYVAPWLADYEIGQAPTPRLKLHGTNQKYLGSRQVPRPYNEHFPPQGFNRLGYISKKQIDTLRADANTYGNVALQVRQGLPLCLFSYPTENPHQPFHSE